MSRELRAAAERLLRYVNIEIDQFSRDIRLLASAAAEDAPPQFAGQPVVQVSKGAPAGTVSNFDEPIWAEDAPPAATLTVEQRFALEASEAAIKDAIYLEDGLDAADGEGVIKAIRDVLAAPPPQAPQEQTDAPQKPPFDKLARNICDELATPQDPQVLVILNTALEQVAKPKEPTGPAIPNPDESRRDNWPWFCATCKTEFDEERFAAACTHGKPKEPGR